MRVGFVSSYPPKHCGIANFCRDLRESMLELDPSLETRLVVTEPLYEHFEYDVPVLARLKKGNRQTYAAAGRALNDAEVDWVFLQHEFGLFGGRRAQYMTEGVLNTPPLGDDIFDFLAQVKAPVVTTLHTVLAKPDRERRDVIRRLAGASAALVTMTKDAKQLLVERYGVDPELVMVIPHGVPQMRLHNTAPAKRALGIDSHDFVMMITGLLGPGKGIDEAIRAMPAILDENPRAVLYIAGQTHPDIVAEMGDIHHENWQALARSLGVDQRVRFVNEYLPMASLVGYIEATDVYLTLHRDAEQSASGTLSYAIGAGKVVVSTPYRYAKEMLAEGRGRLVPIGDHKALAEAICDLIRDPKAFLEIQQRAARLGRMLSWPNVAREYLSMTRTFVGA